MTERDEIFSPFPGTDAETFIQWKGTEVCMDFHCSCGYHGHIDAGFAYFVECGGCGAQYEMGTQVLARRIDPIDDGRVVVAVDHFADAT
jgi:hypothetical protein